MKLLELNWPRLRVFSGLLLLTSALAAQTISAAEIRIKNQSVKILPQSHEALFRLEFDRVPHFYATDPQGVPADSFQYFINYDPSRSYVDNVFDPHLTVIRGDEIHVCHKIRVRESLWNDSDPDPNSGGWGALRGAVPFVVLNKTLIFSVPLELIEAQHGNFGYYVQSFSWGNGDAPIDANARALGQKPNHGHQTAILP